MKALQDTMAEDASPGQVPPHKPKVYSRDVPEDAPLDVRIRSRNSWLLIGVISALSAVFAFKILLSPSQLDLGGLTASDLLSYLLAFFSVGLSVAFYFKANEASNKFYHDTYVFSQHTSEILGRMEERFGEQLRFLGEGQSGLREQMSKLPYVVNEQERVAIESEREVLAKQGEMEGILGEIIKYAPKEKRQDAQTRFAEASKDLARAREAAEAARLEALVLKKKLQALERASESNTDAPVENAEMLAYVRREVIPRLADKIGHPGESLIDAPSSLLRTAFDSIKIDMLPAFLSDAKRAGWLDEADRLTAAGAARIRGLSGEN